MGQKSTTSIIIVCLIAKGVALGTCWQIMIMKRGKEADFSASIIAQGNIFIAVVTNAGAGAGWPQAHRHNQLDPA